MKRSLFTLALLAIAGSASTQAQATSLGISNFRGAASTFIGGDSEFPGGLTKSSEEFLAGHVTDGFTYGTSAFSGYAIESTKNTPIAFVGTTMASTYHKIYNTLLPEYRAADPIGLRVAALGAPVTKPLSGAIVTGSAVIVRVLNGKSGSTSSLPALPGLE